MKAQETALKPMLEGTRQYTVPLYQRRYAWRQEDWEAFWASLNRQYSNLAQGKQGAATHFLGSLVVHPTTISAHGVTVFDIIDGQQRLTSVYILLIALRDRHTAEEERARIEETYLINKFKKGSDLYYKLLSGPQDLPDLKNLVAGKAHQTTGQIGEAYKEFNRRLDHLDSKGTLDLDLLESALLTRMEVVDITTDARDNAHRIFQTLNSTGRSLSQVDLLRNHFFMLLPKRAEEAYSEYWKPIEEALGSSVNLFFWTDLVAREKGAEGTGRDGVYRKWSEVLASLEDDEGRIVDVLADLKDSSETFLQLLNPDTSGSNGIAIRLERLRAWGTTVHYPLTLLLLRARAAGVITETETAEALHYIESYMVRRMLVGIPTNNLNRLFTTTVGQVRGSKELHTAIHKALSSKGKYWPTDDEVLAAIEEQPLYLTQRANQRMFILQRLEEHLSKEHPNWSMAKYTVEHVMPQTLTAEWWDHLGQDTSDDYQALLHSLGNLTLTTENSKLSNGIISRKQDILDGSFLTLNKQIVQTGDHWNYEDIRKRSIKLAQIALQEWAGPLGLTEPTDDFKEMTRTQLAALSGSQWVSLDDLAGFTQTEEDVVREYLIDEKPPGHDRVLDSTGQVDLDLPWVSSDVRAFKSHLVALGVFEDLEDQSATGERVNPNEG